MTTPAGVAAHYGRNDLLDRLRQAVAAAGLSWETLRPEDLAPIDQLHTRGRDATVELAGLAGLSAGQSVLDVGGGLGGPARTLAALFGCQVTVLDLTPEFCEAGEELTRRTGLTDQVRFQVGDALALPFPDRAFDLVWSQHSSMNIPDKPRLYAEIRRVIRPGGRLALHEIAAGPGGPITFPVPWASRAELSFLLPEPELRARIREAGLRERVWRDLSDVSLAWVESRLAAGAAPPAGGPPALGLHMLPGPEVRLAFTNLRDGLAQQRLRVIEAVFELGTDVPDR
jgi:MPBQ/MSBQ methyltransferase